ncbi:Rrf2 family transcriptional regulator [Brevibacterium pityocampae]|uniref:Nitric oxide-sensing transcriptional repressor NsrR n=1 Tax=Brevibacterium pityocampae TaxID=506594 RepID=A0ABP8J718_9MICO
MQVSRFTDLGLRALMMLATAESGTRMTTAELALRLEASETHLAKAISRLSGTGVIASRRGRTGGLTLTEEGRTRPIGSIVRELEGVGAVVDCSTCPLRGNCRLKSVLDRAEQAFLAVLDEVCLSDLVDSPTGPVLLTLLSGPPGDRGPAAPLTERAGPDCGRPASVS